MSKLISWPDFIATCRRAIVFRSFHSAFQQHLESVIIHAIVKSILPLSAIFCKCLPHPFFEGSWNARQKILKVDFPLKKLKPWHMDLSLMAPKLPVPRCNIGSDIAECDRDTTHCD